MIVKETKDVGVDSKGFVYNNIKNLISIFLPLLPFILVSDFLGLYLMPYGPWASLPADVLYIYIWGVFSISWHKLLILGQGSDFKTKLWDVRGSELLFIKALLLVALGANIIIVAPTELLERVIWAPFVSVAALIMYYWTVLRMSLFFPAAAVGAPITIGEAFTAGKELPHKIILSSIYGSLRIVILWVIYVVMVGLIKVVIVTLWWKSQNPSMDDIFASASGRGSALPVSSGQVSIGDMETSFWLRTFDFIALMPSNYIFAPLVCAVCISVVSNYYVQKKPDLRVS